MNNVKTPVTFGIVPLPVCNGSVGGNGFYVSYNSQDLGIYGDITTALVLGQMEKFYILNGDHRLQYNELISKGWDACLDYFKSNLTQMNKYSDKV